MCNWKRLVKKTPGIQNEVMTRPPQNRRLQNSTERTAEFVCVCLLMSFAQPSITVITVQTEDLNKPLTLSIQICCIVSYYHASLWNVFFILFLQDKSS